MLGPVRWIAPLALCALGCTLPLTAGDAGTVDAGSQTVGTQCNAISLAFCTREIGGCGVADTLSDCISNLTPLCCQGTACDATSKAAPAALDTCTSAISTEDCFAVTMGFPAECMGVPN